MRGLSETLVGLTIPLAAVAIALGVFSAGRAWLLLHRSVRLRRSAAAEKFALFLCAACATVGVLMIVGAFRDGSAGVALFGLIQLAFAATGLALYFTARRPLSEAFAAIGMGTFAILTGFSVGAYVAPFAVAMGVVANHHLRAERRIARGEGS